MDDEVETITLVGSMHTMKSDYVSSAMEDNQVKVLRPTDDEMEYIDSARQSIYKGTFTLDDRVEFNDLLKRLNEKAPVMIACTELSIVINREFEVYDLVSLQLADAVNAM